jgi:hypothetical protein
MASVCVEVKSLCSCCAPGRLLSVAHQIASGKRSASNQSPVRGRCRRRGNGHAGCRGIRGCTTAVAGTSMTVAVAGTDVASPHLSPQFSPQFEQSCEPSGKGAPQLLQARVSILSFQVDGNCNHRTGLENRGNSLNCVGRAGHAYVKRGVRNRGKWGESSFTRN